MGSVEKAVDLVKGMLRTHLSALERKVQGEIPIHHPVMAWLVSHVAECLSKYQVGHDGKTPFQRHFGKPVKDEGLEFGELVFYRLRKGEVKDLDAKWMPGLWLGKPWGAITHRIWTGDRTIEAYAVQRRPRDERWSLEELMKVTATPWQWEPELLRAPEEPIVIQGGGPAPDQVVQEEELRGPNPMHITRADLEKWGYTLGCRRCQRI